MWVTVMLSLSLLLSACTQSPPPNVSEARPQISLSSQSSDVGSSTQEQEPHSQQAAEQDSETPDDDTAAVTIAVGDKRFTATFYDNESAWALIGQMPFSLNMADYAGQEKVTQLSFELPSATTEKPDTIYAGELYLWSGDSLVLFYTTFSNSYDDYVSIGYIEDVTGLAEALGNGDVSVTFDIKP